MNSNVHQHSQEFIKRRKKAVVLPFFVVPFMTIIFWIFGGGKKANSVMQHAQTEGGINTSIPSSKNQKIISNKLDAYDKEFKEVEKQKKQIALDEFIFPSRERNSRDSSNIEMNMAGSKGDTTIIELSKKINSFYQKPNLPKYQEKTKDPNPKKDEQLTDQQMIQKELAKAMAFRNQLLAKTEIPSQSQPQPEPKLQETEKRKVMEVQINEETKVVSSLSANKTNIDAIGNKAQQTIGNSFYGSGKAGKGKGFSNTISAVIHQDQSVIDGTTIKMRLLSDIKINGLTIPKNTFIYGIATLNEERMNIEINNIRYQNGIFPVELKVYDADGILGVSIPGSILRNVGKNALTQGIQNMGQAGAYNVTMSNDIGQQLGMEATRTGINTIKSLLTKQTQQKKVFVKANYRVYLK